MNDNHYLLIALQQAVLGKGQCAPNPAVGAVIVDHESNTIISQASHTGPGNFHAEIEALKKIDFQPPANSTLYITLEPCCHWGRTAPCVDAIIKANIKRVVFGYYDPNPLVAGKGAAILRESSIICEHLPTPQITEFYLSYHYWHKTQLPWVTAKIAMSLNGVIAEESGKPLQITGKELRQFTHEERLRSDAILTTSETILCDDPCLNVRNHDQTISKPIYVLDSQLRTPISAKIFKTARSLTFFYSDSLPAEHIQTFLNQGARCIQVPGNDLRSVFQQIGEDGKHDLWVEAGGKLFAALHNEKRMNTAYIYIAPRWINHGKIAFPNGIAFDEIQKRIIWRQYGNDVLCHISFLDDSFLSD